MEPKEYIYALVHTDEYCKKFPDFKEYNAAIASPYYSKEGTARGVATQWNKRHRANSYKVVRFIITKDESYV